MTRRARRTWSVAVAVLLTIVGVGCGQDEDRSTADASASDTPAVEGGSGDLQAFCTAVEALDRTDGTTDSRIVLAAIDEMRRTAPRDIRVDVNRSLDSLVVSNYPDAADTSMEELPLDERQAAGGRMGAYVEAHC